MNKTCLLGILALTLSVTQSVAATDAEVVTEMATKCWKLPEGTDYQRASATFEVTYNAEGELVRIETVEYQPVRRAGKQFAISAQQALMECADRTPVRSRTIRIIMRFVAPQSDGPLIMREPLR
ncbi:hypothetical protein KUG47_04455 [Falsochrobactrum sp. TDYN1]|uniref:TonB C-terminal domain-containing protein n=1 Tax=Falsochrobactrum tianjinense TaxID=2706015 RepID=A0A949PLY6_9HYPH|nr:hypothetical protein [Falsochrobactrum sp. TDYN1]MBV2142750.1 hypothetical protein [Falsochrobactrum sp. TDYN1]